MEAGIWRLGSRNRALRETATASPTCLEVRGLTPGQPHTMQGLPAECRRPVTADGARVA